ncbi:MAG: metallophosphatase family protein [Thermomicrobiales bacterium]|nr:metallophosphatase family protein [Thermomicrobiales bacterium]
MSSRILPTTSKRAFDAPFTIGVISDTHIYTGSRREIAPGVKRLFERAQIDLIVHLGDANSRSVLAEVAELAPLIAVVGNNDDEDLQYLLPQTTRFTVGEFSFAAIHGHGGRSARDVAIERWAGKVNCVLFGHSHVPLIEQYEGTILFNPGSPTDRRWHPHFGVGVITIDKMGIHPDLVLFDQPDHLDSIQFEDRGEA